ncbi:Putative 60S ribosomal protein L37a [Geodia barretti]|uniref:60S ribosomal protein L37a n=1 Tax=Geodia barretti TaxID=519541 RepID=A0AA35RRJ2_GEOBA|nr:Putative 60S ribosomal protein L37a [Geodia barretti]
MAKRTKKVGVVGKYGTRYGSSLRKMVKKIEISQHGKYICYFCGKVSRQKNGTRLVRVYWSNFAELDEKKVRGHLALQQVSEGYCRRSMGTKHNRSCNY